MNKTYGLYPDDEIVDCGMDRNEVDGHTAYFTDGFSDGYGAGYDAAAREEASNPECPDKTAAGEYKKGWVKGYKEGYRDRLDAVVVPMSDDEEDDEDMFGV